MRLRKMNKMKLIKCSQFIYPGEEDKRLGDLFPHLKNIEMELRELDFCVRMHNILKRGGVHTLKQLLSYSFTELSQSGIGRGKDGFMNALKYRLSQLNEQYKIPCRPANIPLNT